ncbi:MAG: hypothetical protein HQ512_01165 [Rhodospirillales bacterium]|nr:hypothetical protein [Rhodospirillales bacterium]
MSDQPENGAKPPEIDPDQGHQVFIDLLEESGFFKQIHNLEENLKVIAEELKSFGENARDRMAETENLAAHVLALESILSVMLKTYPISADDLKAEIKDRTAALTGQEDGSPTVQALALDLLDKTKK